MLAKPYREYGDAESVRRRRPRLPLRKVPNKAPSLWYSTRRRGATGVPPWGTHGPGGVRSP
jgi:hypothetical protein